MADPRPRNIVHISQTDIDHSRLFHVTEEEQSQIGDAISGWSSSAPTSGTLFAFNAGGSLGVSADGKNLVYSNVDGVSAQITNFS